MPNVPEATQIMMTDTTDLGVMQAKYSQVLYEFNTLERRLAELSEELAPFVAADNAGDPNVAWAHFDWEYYTQLQNQHQAIVAYLQVVCQRATSLPHQLGQLLQERLTELQNQQ